MPIDFSELKKLSGAPTALENLAKEFEKLQKKTYKDDDDTYWYPNVDGAGNSKCVIRFLPAPPGESVPFVREYSYSFKHPVTNQWYIEKSLETIDKDDPVSELWSEWYTGYGKDDERVKLLSRKLAFISNVLVIKDGMNSENNGKVKRFRFGKKIFDKLQAKMAPEIEGVEAVNPFDPWTGMDFHLVVKKKAGFRNYDDSDFGPQKPLGDDSFIETVWKQCHSLQEIKDEKNFKSYEDLKTRLYKVLGLNKVHAAPSAALGVGVSVERPSPLGLGPIIMAKGEVQAPVDTPPWEVEKETRVSPPEAPKLETDDDKRLEFFRNLANKA